jgi:hypothetical protein
MLSRRRKPIAIEDVQAKSQETTKNKTNHFQTKFTTNKKSGQIRQKKLSS